MQHDLDDILPCFFDMTLADATRILKVSGHSIIKCRKRMGIQQWPFDSIKKGVFKLNWAEIRSIREERLSIAKGRSLELLKAAEKRGWLMARIHEGNATKDHGTEDLQCMDGLFHEEEPDIAEESNPHQPNEQLEEDEQEPEEPIYDEPLRLDFEGDADLTNFQFPDNEEDAEEWGLLGFGDDKYYD
jgi:hypothetical protein